MCGVGPAPLLGVQPPGTPAGPSLCLGDSVRRIPFLSGRLASSAAYRFGSPLVPPLGQRVVDRTCHQIGRSSHSRAGVDLSPRWQAASVRRTVACSSRIRRCRGKQLTPRQAGGHGQEVGAHSPGCRYRTSPPPRDARNCRWVPSGLDPDSAGVSCSSPDPGYAGRTSNSARTTCRRDEGTGGRHVRIGRHACPATHARYRPPGQRSPAPGTGELQRSRGLLSGAESRRTSSAASWRY